MISRERLEEIVREELASALNTDDASREHARTRIDEEAEDDRILRHVRERRGLPVDDDEGR